MSLMSHIISTLEYIFAIVTLLGGVIAVHEFGHFIFAKFCGARVDTFSIGFGPKIFAHRWGETEYCLSLIPLGGFVKIYGQDPEETATDPNPQPERSLAHKSLMARLGVFIGGPAFNYILAIFLFSFMAMVGMQKLPSVATRVVVNSPAYHAGLRSGDTIASVDGKKMSNFDELMQVIATNPDKTLGLQIIRDEKNFSLPMPVQKEISITPYGEPAMAGVLDGLEPLGREPVIASTSTINSWGLKTGDKIISIENESIKSWESLEAFFERHISKLPASLNIKVLRDGKETLVTTPALTKNKANVSAQEFLENAGVFNSELFIMQTMPGSPADKAGLRKGDRIISVNGNKVYSFENLRAKIQQSGEDLVKANKDASLASAVHLSVEREGKIISLVSSLISTKGKDPLGQTIMSYTIGIQGQGVPLFPSNMVVERTLNPFKALVIGSKETIQHTVMTVVGLKKLAFGEVSMKAVGGPIMIGKLAGDTFSTRGWRDFLRIMAIISISLGVFNLLPLPILDGGHVVFAIVESVRGEPISQRVMQVFMKVGLSLLIMLMIFAVYNDLTKVLPF